ncbi:MAG: hypothetical protein DI535_04170 [Citrobacter freundii]|nr:MAG: hypothetical protein DI535_04170 [Citrobacter freundii]
MKFLSKPGNSVIKRFFIFPAIPLLLLVGSGSAQEKPDSLFEKVTLSFLKNEKPEQKIKDGQRLLFLHFNGYTADQKKFYYRYRDSLLGIATDDTILLKPEIRKKMNDQFINAGISNQLPFYFAVDELINQGDTLISKQTVSSYAALTKENQELKGVKETLRYSYWALAATAAILLMALLLFFRARKRIREQEEIIENSASKQSAQPEPGSDKRTKKLADDLKKLKEEKKQVDEQKQKLQEEKTSLEKEKETLTKKNEALTKSLAELESTHKTATTSLEKTEKEKTTLEETSAKLQDDLNKLSAIQKDQEDQAKKISEIITRLEAVVPPTSFPDINSTLHAWFLLQEFIKGYKSKEFSVLSTPNFSKWVLKEEHTYPELDTTNLAGNAPIINFLIDLKKRKITKVSPDGSYMILINQKITQPIFDSLEPAE